MQRKEGCSRIKKINQRNRLNKKKWYCQHIRDWECSSKNKYDWDS